MSVWNKIKILITGDTEFAANTVGTLYAVAPNNATADQVVVRSLDTATRVNSSGNIETVVANKARIDYSLGVDRCANLLVEKTIQNKVTNSYNQLETAVVRGEITKLLNNIISPSGLQDATKYTTAVTNFWGGENYTGIDGVFTATIYLNKLGVNITSFRSFLAYNQTTTQSIAAATIDYSTMTLTSIGGWASATLTKYLNTEWYKLVLTSPSSFALTAAQSIYIYWGGSGVAASSVIGESIGMWGAKVEQGAISTSDILSSGTLLTRNADVISKTGLSALIPQTKGGLFFDGYLQAGSLSDGVIKGLGYLAINGTESSNSVTLYRYNNNIYFEVYVGAVQQVFVSQPITSPLKDKRIKVYVAYEANNTSFYLNGELIYTYTSGTIPTCDKIKVGDDARYGGFWDGLIKAVAVTDELTTVDIDQLSQYNSFEEMADQMQYDYFVA